MRHKVRIVQGQRPRLRFSVGYVQPSLMDAITAVGDDFNYVELCLKNNKTLHNNIYGFDYIVDYIMPSQY